MCQNKEILSKNAPKVETQCKNVLNMDNFKPELYQKGPKGLKLIYELFTQPKTRNWHDIAINTCIIITKSHFNVLSYTTAPLKHNKIKHLTRNVALVKYNEIKK